MKTLDLGCGKRKRQGAVGVDISRDTDADVVHDLNVFPYPFADNEFDYVYMDNTLEHLDNVVRVMEEVHRIAKTGATIEIIVPYFRSPYAYIDPTHKHFFTTMSFNYFDPTHQFNKLYKYSDVHFRVKNIVFDEKLPHGFFGRMVNRFANRYKTFYEFVFSGVYSLSTLTFYLEKVE